MAPVYAPQRPQRKTYNNTDRGALFKNDRKEQDNDPDYRGNINIDGVEYWLNAWIKTSKAGTKFMSLSVKPKDEPGKPGELNDEVPF